jgi:hypothetical protein
LGSAVISHLRNWDFVVETHDGLVPGITKTLLARFADTHETVVIEAVHDFDKADHVSVPILEGLERRTIDRILSEGREHACLRWIYCTPMPSSR